MPTCKNDCKRYYRGDEPSPKGLGYCAHAEKINQRRKGRDGKFWVVKAIKLKSGKRIRRWTRVKKAVTKKRKITGGMLGVYHPTQDDLRKRATKKRQKEKDLKRIAELQLQREEKYIKPNDEQELDKLSEKYHVDYYLKKNNRNSRLNEEKVKGYFNKLVDDQYESVTLTEALRLYKT